MLAEVPVSATQIIQELGFDAGFTLMHISASNAFKVLSIHTLPKSTVPVRFWFIKGATSVKVSWVLYAFGLLGQGVARS